MKLVKLPRKNSARALTLVEVFVIGVVICLLVFLLSPSFRRAKERAQRITCNGNLKGVGSTFRIREMDTKGKFPMQVSITHGGVMELIQPIWKLRGKGFGLSGRPSPFSAKEFHN